MRDASVMEACGEASPWTAITATEGDVVLRDGRLGSHGGYSTWQGGRAGSITITAAGSILLAGTIEAPGGDSIEAGSATSGAGGDVMLRVTSHTGDVVAAAGGQVIADGDGTGEDGQYYMQ